MLLGHIVEQGEVASVASNINAIINFLKHEIHEAFGNSGKLLQVLL